MFNFLKKANTIRDPFSADMEVISQLQKAGSDISKEHDCDFFFYGSEENLVTLENKLNELGFSKIQNKKSGGMLNMLKRIVPSPENMTNLTKELLGLCVPLGIDYDGWGAMIVK